MEQTEEMQAAIDELRTQVEQFCGFRPESAAQAITLLTTRIMEIVPALDALTSVALELDHEKWG